VVLLVSITTFHLWGKWPSLVATVCHAIAIPIHNPCPDPPTGEMQCTNPKRDPHSPKASDHEKPQCPTNLPAERRLAARSGSVLHSLISCCCCCPSEASSRQDHGMDGWMENQKRRRQDGWMTDPPSRKPAPPRPNANPINNSVIDTICNCSLLVVFMLLASASLAIFVSRPPLRTTSTQLTVDRSCGCGVSTVVAHRVWLARPRGAMTGICEKFKASSVIQCSRKTMPSK